MPSETKDLEFLSLKNIEKDFSGVRALQGITLSIRKGEIHALVGENGAGKSTILKIIGGILPYGSYAGSVSFKGIECRFHSPREAKEVGISLIHQELELVPEMSVAENIALAGPSRAWRKRASLLERIGWMDRKTMVDRALSILKELDMDLDPESRVARQGAGKKQMVVIARALSGNFGLLLLDEPTSSLSLSESEILLDRLKRLKEKQVTILYVSHRLREVFEIADRITVLRDGRKIETLERSRTHPDEIIRLMAGKTLGEIYPRKPKRVFQKEVLRVKDLCIGDPDPSLRVHFSIHEGEILGLAGLLGSGRTEILETLFGLRKPLSGSLFIEGRFVRIHSPKEAIRLGLALLSEDRQETGLVMSESVRNNLTLPFLKRFARFGLIRESKETACAQAMVSRLSIKAAGLSARTDTLSGGNQQKVAFGKWLFQEPKVFLMDEPTRGVDVGAKSEIYTLVEELASRGIGILLVSSEFEELLGLCDRILTLSQGRITGEFTPDEADTEILLRAMTRHLL